MKFNGIDPTTLHRAISIAKEIPPGMAKRSIVTVRGNRAEMLGSVQDEMDEYVVRVNIAGKDPQEAWAVREILAGWASSSGKETAQLIPTHRPGVYYDAIVSEISPPEFRPRFATVEVVFALPDSRAASVSTKNASGSTSGTSVSIMGSSDADMVISQTLSASASGLTWSMDGEAILGITGTVSSGQTVEVDFKTGSILIAGSHAERRANYMTTRWRPGFTKGTHKITSSASGTLSAKWRERWM